MRIIASICLLAILLFNGFGHRLLLGWLQQKAQADLETSIDSNEYNESDLVTIKVPIKHLSYYIASPEFERVDGNIELGGIQYKYVKRRMFNDSLELRCLPNHTAMKWQSAKRQASHPLLLKAQEESPYLLQTVISLYQPVFRQAPNSLYQDCFFPSPFPATNDRPPNQLV